MLIFSAKNTEILFRKNIKPGEFWTTYANSVKNQNTNAKCNRQCCSLPHSWTHTPQTALHLPNRGLAPWAHASKWSPMTFLLLLLDSLFFRYIYTTTFYWLYFSESCLNQGTVYKHFTILLIQLLIYVYLPHPCTVSPIRCRTYHTHHLYTTKFKEHGGHSPTIELHLHTSMDTHIYIYTH